MACVRPRMLPPTPTGSPARARTAWCRAWATTCRRRRRACSPTRCWSWCRRCGGEAAPPGVKACAELLGQRQGMLEEEPQHLGGGVRAAAVGVRALRVAARPGMGRAVHHPVLAQHPPIGRVAVDAPGRGAAAFAVDAVGLDRGSRADACGDDL